MALTLGQHVTLLKIDEMMALSHRYELEVRGVVATEERVGYEGRYLRLAVVRQRGKRKEHYLDCRSDEILLDGWDVPFRTDTDCYGKDGSIMSGNACYNLVGDPEVIRAYLESHAVRPITDQAKAMILVSRQPPTGTNQDDVQLLYPDIETGHAVIRRFKGRD
jgi:hypothetical protein